MRQAVTTALKDGFTAVKLHQIDEASVAAAREVAGADVDIMLDTNCPWTVEDAIRIGRKLERYDLRWLEEPVWPPEDYAGLARVRQAVRIPIACGENEATAFAFREIIAAGAVDIVQPSLTKVGGIGEMKKIAVLAASGQRDLRAALVLLRPGTRGDAPRGGLDARRALRRDAAGTARARRCWRSPSGSPSGAVHVPDGPGLGADPDPEVFRRHAYTPRGCPAVLPRREMAAHVRRLLIFDFDGLILDTEAPVYDAWQEIYGEHGHSLAFEKWAQCIGTADVFDPCTDLQALVARPIDGPRAHAASSRAHRRAHRHAARAAGRARVRRRGPAARHDARRGVVLVGRLGRRSPATAGPA